MPHTHRVWRFSYSGLWPFWGLGSVHVNGGRAWSLRKRIWMDVEHDMLQDVMVDTKSLLSLTRTIQALDHPTKEVHSSAVIPQKLHRWRAFKHLTDCLATSGWTSKNKTNNSAFHSVTHIFGVLQAVWFSSYDPLILNTRKVTLCTTAGHSELCYVTCRPWRVTMESPTPIYWTLMTFEMFEQVGNVSS